MTRYAVFTRTWWRYDSSYPNGLAPHPGPKSRKGHPQNLTSYEAAQDYCRVWNANHTPGRFSRKAEFESVPSKYSK